MATYWLDLNRGSDFNEGSSATKAWRHLEMLETIIWSPGDKIFLADDSEWYLTNRITLRACNGTAPLPIIFDRYNPKGGASSSYPILRLRYQPQVGDWTYDATARAWFFVDPSGAKPGDVQGSGVMLLGPEKQHGVFVRKFRAPFTNLTLPGHWSVNPANRRYYLYAPANVNPTAYYDGVLLGPPAESFAALMFLRCGSYVQVRNIKFQECGHGVTVGRYTSTDPNFVSSDTVHFSMEGCVGYNVGSLVRLVADYVPGTFQHVILDARVAGNRIDRCATAGVRVLNAARVIVENNIGDDATGRSWSIGFVYLDVANGHPRAGSGQVIGNRFSRAAHGTEFSGSDNSFDGSAIYCEAGTRGVQVRGNIVTDCHTAFTDNGGNRAGNTWMANIVDRCDRGFLITDADQIDNGITRFLNNLFVLDGGATAMPAAPGVTGATRHGGYFTGTGVDSAVIANNIIHSRVPAGFGVVVNPALKPYVTNNILSGFRVPYGTTSGVPYLNGSNRTDAPQFVNVDQPELGLQPGSNAQSSGVWINGLVDHVGRSYFNPPNIGPWAVLPR